MSDRLGLKEEDILQDMEAIRRLGVIDKETVRHQQTKVAKENLILSESIKKSDACNVKIHISRDNSQGKSMEERSNEIVYKIVKNSERKKYNVEKIAGETLKYNGVKFVPFEALGDTQFRSGRGGIDADDFGFLIRTKFVGENLDDHLFEYNITQIRYDANRTRQTVGRLQVQFNEDFGSENPYFAYTLPIRNSLASGIQNYYFFVSDQTLPKKKQVLKCMSVVGFVHSGLTEGTGGYFVMKFFSKMSEGLNELFKSISSRKLKRVDVVAYLLELQNLIECVGFVGTKIRLKQTTRKVWKLFEKVLVNLSILIPRGLFYVYSGFQEIFYKHESYTMVCTKHAMELRQLALEICADFDVKHFILDAPQAWMYANSSPNIDFKKVYELYLKGMEMKSSATNTRAQQTPLRFQPLVQYLDKVCKSGQICDMYVIGDICDPLDSSTWFHRKIQSPISLLRMHHFSVLQQMEYLRHVAMRNEGRVISLEDANSERAEEEQRIVQKERKIAELNHKGVLARLHRIEIQYNELRASMQLLLRRVDGKPSGGDAEK